MKVKYLIKLCKTFGLTFFIPCVFYQTRLMKLVLDLFGMNRDKTHFVFVLQKAAKYFGDSRQTPLI